MERKTSKKYFRKLSFCVQSSHKGPRKVVGSRFTLRSIIMRFQTTEVKRCKKPKKTKPVFIQGAKIILASDLSIEILKNNAVFPLEF